MKDQLRKKYKEVHPEGKNAFWGWSEEELKAKIKEYTGQEIETAEDVRDTANFERYKELPPPIVEYLELTFGNWLNYMEVGQEYKKGFGGYGIYVKVPEKFSTEFKREKVTVYDNRTQLPMKDDDGNTMVNEVVREDIRWCSLMDLAQAKSWLDKVKEHVITNAYKKGMQLPNTNTKLDDTKETMEEYKKAVHA